MTSIGAIADTSYSDERTNERGVDVHRTPGLLWCVSVAGLYFVVGDVSSGARWFHGGAGDFVYINFMVSSQGTGADESCTLRGRCSADAVRGSP